VIDAAMWQGRHYVVDAPFPAFVLLPFVIVFGPTVNQTMLSIAAGVLGTWLAWRLCLRLGVPRTPRLFLTAFMFAGTALWWCAMLGDVTFCAHTCAVAMTFAALNEALGKRRGWLVGVCAVCAVESRFPLVMALPLYAVMVGPARLRSYAAAIAGGVVFWVSYNEAQWGLPYDIGHHIFFLQDPFGESSGSPFDVKYLPNQLYSFFLRAPAFVQAGHQQTQWPYLKIEPDGVALTFTSPALILAFCALRTRLVWAMWITALLVAIPDLLYYQNGNYQASMRHALDFEPFIFVIMAQACTVGMPRWGMLLCTWSALVGTWGVWFWDTVYRTGD
jgi:hypothetical protein